MPCILVLALLLTEPRHEFGTWVGVSAGTPTLIGKTERVSFFVTAIRYSRIVMERPTFSVRYTMDAFPVARLRHLSQTSNEFETVTGRGGAPFGFETRFRPAKRISPFVAFSGGFIYFESDLPQAGKRFNFSADFGAGVRIGLGDSIGVNGGYKYHHLSNGYRSPVNPGFDSSLIFVGFNLTR